MALTAEGKELTEANRVGQLAIAAQADIEARALWSRLHVSNLDASTPAWMAANIAVLRRRFGQSVDMAASYVGDYREAEIGTDAGKVVAPTFSASEEAGVLLLAGPVRVKLLVGRGMNPDAAHAAGLKKFTGLMRRQVLSGGRQLIDLTTHADTQAVGWRRVSDGNPCTFCAMLCSRGPVYRSAAVAAPIAGSGLEYHGHCGCTAEIVYGEWKPTPEEKRYIDEYDRAAREANAAGDNRTQNTVLPRMRKGGGFRDSPAD
jgi:hypothetical protein